MAKNGCGTLWDTDKKSFVVEYYVFVYWNVLEVVSKTMCVKGP